jgi:hypothetical protein
MRGRRVARKGGSRGSSTWRDHGGYRAPGRTPGRGTPAGRPALVFRRGLSPYVRGSSTARAGVRRGERPRLTHARGRTDPGANDDGHHRLRACVRRAHHCDVDSDAVESHDPVHPATLDERLALQLHPEFDARSSMSRSLGRIACPLLPGRHLRHPRDGAPALQGRVQVTHGAAVNLLRPANDLVNDVRDWCGGVD